MLARVLVVSALLVTALTCFAAAALAGGAAPKAARVPEPIMAKLQSLKDREFSSVQEFELEVDKALSGDSRNKADVILYRS